MDLEDNFNLSGTQIGQPEAPQAHYSVLSNTAASTAGKNVYNRHYKDITFDTLKERHDNFSFEKVLATKHQIYNTMHFTGVVERPNNPNQVMFMKQGNADKLNREYSNSKY